MRKGLSDKCAHFITLAWPALNLTFIDYNKLFPAIVLLHFCINPVY